MYTDSQPPADKFLQEKILLLVYQYIIGKDSQRYLDAFRGIVFSLFSFDLIELDKFLFLFNFVSWLENKNIFSDEDSAMYQHFFDIYISDIQEGLESDII